MSVASDEFHVLVDRLATDPASWGLETRVGALGELQGLRGWLDAREAAVLEVAHLQCDDVNSGARDITQLCQQTSNVSFGEAKRRATRAEWLPQLDHARRALEAGTLGSAQCDELCSLAERLDPTQIPVLAAAEISLVSELQELTPVQARKCLTHFETEIHDEDRGKTKLERQQRDNSLRFTKRSDDTVGLSGQLDPISAQYVRNCIDHKVSQMWRRESAGRNQHDPPTDVMTNDRRRAEALVELIRQAHTGQSSGGGGTEMLVLIDYQTLLGQLAETGICEMGDGTPIPPDVARQMACEAKLIPLVLGGPSVPLDVGRASRMATAGQRAALRAVHDTCCIKTCDIAFTYCQIHHITWWRNTGNSDLANLAPICSKHHHLIHDHHWTLTLNPNRVGTLTRDHTPTSTANARTSNRHPEHEPFPQPPPDVADLQANPQLTDRRPHRRQDTPTPMRC